MDLLSGMIPCQPPDSSAPPFELVWLPRTCSRLRITGLHPVNRFQGTSPASMVARLVVVRVGAPQAEAAMKSKERGRRILGRTFPTTLRCRRRGTL